MQALVNPETGRTCEGVVLQQFEEHGGVLFKVYVLGSTCEVKLRPSLQLPQEARHLHSSRSGWIALPRFSTTPIAEDQPAPPAESTGDVDEGSHAGWDNSATPGSSPGRTCTLLYTLVASLPRRQIHHNQAPLLNWMCCDSIPTHTALVVPISVGYQWAPNPHMCGSNPRMRVVR
jgi:hypothetical protein